MNGIEPRRRTIASRSQHWPITFARLSRLESKIQALQVRIHKSGAVAAIHRCPWQQVYGYHPFQRETESLGSVRSRGRPHELAENRWQLASAGYQHHHSERVAETISTKASVQATGTGRAQHWHLAPEAYHRSQRDAESIRLMRRRGVHRKRTVGIALRKRTSTTARNEKLNHSSSTPHPFTTIQ